MKLVINNGKLNEVFFKLRHQLLSELERVGCQVILTGMRNEDFVKSNNIEMEYYDFDAPYSGISPVRDSKLILAYRKLIKRHNIDIVHSYTAKANIYGSIGAHLAGIKKVYPMVNGLGYAFTDGIKKKKCIKTIMKMLYKVAFLCSDKVFFQNPDDAKELIDCKVVSREKCVIIAGSGIDIEEYGFDPNYRENTFLLASRLLGTKGVREYCEAARLVKKKYPTAEFFLAGGLDPGPDGIRIEEIQGYIDKGEIQYLGHVNNMKEVLASCSVFVLPSYYREGVPHAILEAMSIGRAIITCDSPGCRETINEKDDMGRGTNGFVVAPRNAEGIAKAISWMIENPNEVRQMGIESRKYAKDRFDVNNINRIILKTMGLL